SGTQPRGHRMPRKAASIFCSAASRGRLPKPGSFSDPASTAGAHRSHVVKTSLHFVKTSLHRRETRCKLLHLPGKLSYLRGKLVQLRGKLISSVAQHCYFGTVWQIVPVDKMILISHSSLHNSNS